MTQSSRTIQSDESWTSGGMKMDVSDACYHDRALFIITYLLIVYS